MWFLSLPVDTGSRVAMLCMIRPAKVTERKHLQREESVQSAQPSGIRPFSETQAGTHVVFQSCP